MKTVLISVTRLRLRSFRYLLPFFGQALVTARQAQRSPGFCGGKLLYEARNTFWTLTAWEDEAAMRAYRIAGVHGKVMHNLLNWCDEASVVHWHQENSELPSWQATHQRMVAEGRRSKINHPSAAHTDSEIALPWLASPFELPLTPHTRTERNTSPDVVR